MARAAVNELHVPVNKPVHFVMTSEDVLHDFFIPDMRVKHDIVPGRYTADLVHAQPCWRAHVPPAPSTAARATPTCKAKLIVDTPADFAKWMETGGTEWEEYRDKNTWQEWGKIQYERKGCNTCHTVDGTTSKGPSWKGIWGKMVNAEQRQRRCWWTRLTCANR